jgi:hypothetical protein
MQLVWTENADPFCDDDHFQPKKKATSKLVASKVRFIEPVLGRSVGARSFDLDALALVVANGNPNGL